MHNNACFTFLKFETLLKCDFPANEYDIGSVSVWARSKLHKQQVVVVVPVLLFTAQGSFSWMASGFRRHAWFDWEDYVMINAKENDVPEGGLEPSAMGSMGKNVLFHLLYELNLISEIHTILDASDRSHQFKLVLWSTDS